MQSDLKFYNRAIKKVAEDLGLNPNKVDKVYRAYCKLIVDKISSLPLTEDLTEEEFNKLQTNINLPSLGKLYVTWQMYKNIKQKYKYVQKAQENKAAKHRSVSNDDSV